MIIKFSDIIGQETLKNRLIKTVKDKDPSQAYILEGEKLSGKKTLASAFAASLVCEKDGVEACGECHSCKMAASGTHPDIIWLSPDKFEDKKKQDPGKQIKYKIDDIREQLIDDVGMRPYYSEYKIYILDEAQTLNIASQNALLKTLEDPPQYVIIMLLATDTDGFLDTVRSRCASLSMMPLPDAQMIRHIMHKSPIPEYEARMIASFARGSIGRAFHLVDGESIDSRAFADMRSGVTKILSRITEKPLDILLSETSDLLTAMEKDYPGRFSEIIDLFAVWYRDVLVYKALGDKTLLTFGEESYAVSQMARSRSYPKLKSDFTAVLNAQRQLTANVRGERVLQQLVISLH